MANRYNPKRKRCIWRAVGGSTARRSAGLKAIRWLYASSIGWRGQRETCSTRWTRLAKLAQRSSRWANPWADTTTPHGRLMLTVLGGLAEFERHLILSRTAEGRTRAQANGVRFGRKPSLTAYQRAEALRRRAAGETLTSIAQLFGVSHMTIARLGNE